MAVVHHTLRLFHQAVTGMSFYKAFLLTSQFMLESMSFILLGADKNRRSCFATLAQTRYKNRYNISFAWYFRNTDSKATMAQPVEHATAALKVRHSILWHTLLSLINFCELWTNRIKSAEACDITPACANVIKSSIQNTSKKSVMYLKVRWSIYK